MGNQNLIPTYETIVRATEGEPEAVDEVLQYYSRRIRYAAIENGHVNPDTEDSKCSCTIKKQATENKR